MTVLLAQIFLLLLGAFLLGATLACLLRRAIASSRQDVEPVLPAASVVAEPAAEPVRPRSADAERFERALVGEAGAGVPLPLQANKGPVVEVQPLEEPPPAVVAPPPAPMPPPVEVPAPAPAAAPPPEVTAPKPASDYPAAIVAAAAAAATAAAATVAAPAAAAASALVTPIGPPDDLTRIRSIDADLQRRLNNLGYTRFDQIAVWTPSDVTRTSQSLGFYGRIEQENWIEQAQILAKGGETEYSRRRTEMPPQPPVSALHRIIGVTPPAEHILNKNGVTDLVQVANWSAADVERFEGLLGDPGRIGRENWIEQARLLSGIGVSQASAGALVAPIAAEALRVVGVDPETEETVVGTADPHLSQIAGWSAADLARLDAARGGSIDPLPSAPAAEPRAEVEPPPAPIAASEPEELVSPAAADAVSGRSDGLGNLRSVRSEALRGEGFADPVSGVIDDLKRIRGIGILIEKKLNSLGVTSYEQVANWTGADIDRISEVLDFKGRIERENWVEQARILASGGQTEFSRRADRGEI